MPHESGTLAVAHGQAAGFVLIPLHSSSSSGQCEQSELCPAQWSMGGFQLKIRIYPSISYLHLHLEVHIRPFDFSSFERARAL